MRSISIIGCGWLGLPLAERLIESGYKVKGSTRSEEDLPRLTSVGIEPYLLAVEPELRGKDSSSFFKSDVLIINFPPERRDDIVEYHEIQARYLIKEIRQSPISKVVFVSSTSVYPDLNREVKEDDTQEPEKLSGKALLRFESLLNDCLEFDTTVLRFAGLVGYDRNPGRFLAGKRELKNGSAPVNLIHRDDCINIIHKIIEKDLWGRTYNACADIHPKRKDYYINASKNLGIKPPEFIVSDEYSYKIVNSDKLKKDLDYSYIYPDPSKIYDPIPAN